jgi:ATP-dependent 26S proteasome regulatory subunit
MAEAARLADLPAAPAAGAPRLDRALARLAGRLAEALEQVGGDPASVAFLRSQAAPVSAGRASDGTCLDLLAGGHVEPVDRLVTRLALPPIECDLAVLAALAHQHEGTAAILRGLHPQGHPWATVGLAGTLAELGLLAGARSRAEVGAALGHGRLARARAVVVEGDGPFPERSLRLGPLLWEALTGLDGWPVGCEAELGPSPAAGLEGWFAEPAVRAAGVAIERRAPVAVLAVGDRPEALTGRLGALVAAAGAEPVALRLPAPDERSLTRILLLALVRGVVPVICSDTELPCRLGGLGEVPVPLVLALRGGDLTTWPRPLLPVPTGPLAPTDRLAALAAVAPELGPLRHPIGPATVEPRELAVAAADARAHSLLLGHRGSAEELRGQFSALLDARTAASVPAGAVLVHPAADWDDLVLPDDRIRQLREAADRMRTRSVVLDQWGFLRGRRGRAGLRLLFSGPPGTGKTLAAEVIATELGRDLLVVDLSRLVSKWIGETEKNLASVFDAAERGGAALFFDEADALFGRRTEVGDARDRYANLETAYLLSRLERFDGVAVLATNLRQNIDPAFARRIEFVVPFDLPDEAEREQLWRRHLPEPAPVDQGVDLRHLAALYALPGALIRNAAVAAAFLAAASPTDRTITTSHVIHAIRREYIKAGLAFPGAPSGVLGPPA